MLWYLILPGALFALFVAWLGWMAVHYHVGQSDRQAIDAARERFRQLRAKVNA